MTKTSAASGAAPAPAGLVPVRPRFKPWTAFAFSAIHLGALAACFPYFFSWPGLILAVGLAWATTSLGVSLAYHRLLSHRSWRAKPGLRAVLIWLACLALEMGPIKWAATHRLHHRESDHDDDPHSPLVSFLWAHTGWMLYENPGLENPETLARLAPDLARDPVLRFFERTFAWHWLAVALLSGLVGYLCGGPQLALSLIVWGSLARTVWVWHATWCVNSVTHLFGYRNYHTDDDSRNLWWVALLTCGEGWHNNHHAQAGVAGFGRKWWELDPTFWALRLFQSFGWVESVNVAKPLPASTPAQRIGRVLVAKSQRLRSMLKERQLAVE
jgi:sn-2 palmitoyl-lipid 9-desaturase